MGADAEVGQRPGANGEERLEFFIGELRERTPVAIGEDDATERTALHVDRDAGFTQGLDIAVDRPDRDREFVGQIARGQPTLTLEELQTRNLAL